MIGRKVPPKMSDVAQAAGVSVMTVSRAFRDNANVSRQTRLEILKIAEEMGYVFDRAASELRTGRTGFVAVTVPSLNNPNFADSVRGLTDGLSANGLEVLLGYTDYDIEREETLIRQMLRRKPEALVVTGGTHTPGTVDVLARASVPVIEVWDEPNEPIDVSVGFSNAGAGSLMAGHLIEGGYQHIGFVGCSPGSDYRGEARMRGFMETLDANGLETHRAIEVGRPPIGAREGVQAARTLLEKFPETDAVMCVADSVAYGMITEFQREGILVPGQVAVAGFGAYEMGAVGIPSMTTIDPNAYLMGSLAAKRIGQVLEGNPTSLKPTHVGATPALIIRQSTRRDPR